MKHSLKFFLILFLGSELITCGEDWSRWRGNSGDGTWDGPNLMKELPESGLKKCWQYKVSPGYSGVTVANALAYLMDKPSGENGEQERVICVNVNSGELVWEYVYPVNYAKLDYGKGPRASVTVNNGKAYGMGAMGHAFCLDAKLGNKIWSRNLVEEEGSPPPIWGYSSSPEPYNDVILFHAGGESGNVLALDATSGITRWKVGDDKKAGYAPPILIRMDDREQLICWGPNKIMGLPVGGGSPYWNIPYAVKYGVSIAKPIFVDGTVLVCGYWNGSRAIKLAKNGYDAEILWAEEEALRGLMAQPLHREGIIYLLDRSNGLTAFELKTGKILWRDGHKLTAAGRNPHATLIWLSKTGGGALSLNAEGELVYLDLSPEGFDEHWREQVCGETWAHPAYTGSKILARDDRSLYCWELPVAK